MAPLSAHHAAFGEAIRQLRKELGIAQEALALKSGLNRGYYGDVERGERNISLANIIKIATALEVPASTIFARYEHVLSDAEHHRVLETAGPRTT